MVEHLTFNQGVRGSSLRWVTKKDRVHCNAVGSVFFDVSAQETLQSAGNVPYGPKRHTCSAAYKDNPDRILMICMFFYQNQYSFISDKNSVVIGNPEYAPITESIPQ